MNKTVKVDMEKKIKNTVNSLSKLDYVNSIILFGSYNTEKFNANSDIDIAVITNNQNKKNELDLFGYGNEDIDISVFSRLPLQVQFRVFKEGKVLFCRDKMLFNKIKYETFRMYLDMQLFFKRFYWRVIENV